MKQETSLVRALFLQRLHVNLEKLTNLPVNDQVSDERRLDEPRADQAQTDSLSVAPLPEPIHQPELPCLGNGVENGCRVGSEERSHRSGDD